MVDFLGRRENAVFDGEIHPKNEKGPSQTSIPADFTNPANLKERLRKTMRYGKNPSVDRPSMHLTELAVELIQDAAPRELGRVDMDWASLVSRQAAVSPCALLLALVYIERLRHRNPEYLQEVSSSDLFLVSMMVASKFLYDEGVTEEVFNDEWAQAANIDVSDLNEMERTFLYAMDWQLFVNGGEFWTVLNQVERWISRKAGVTYGLLSYLDLSLLSEAPKFQQNTSECLRTLSQVMMVCSLAYVASVSILAFTPAALSSVHSGLRHTQHILNDLSAQDWILPLPASPLLDFPEPSSNESETPRSVSAVSGLLALSLLTACVDTPCGQQREKSPVLNPQMPDVVNERLSFHGYEDPDVMMNNDVNQVVIQRPQSIEGLVPNWRKCDFGEVLGWQKGLQVLNHAVTC